MAATRTVPQPRLRTDCAEAVVACALFTAIVFLSQWQYGFNLGDEGLQWYLSQRVQFGEMPIRDFFGYDPGRYLWSAAWFKALGADGLFEQRLANTCFGFIGLASAYLAMSAAGLRRAIRLPTAVLLAVALGYPLHKVYEQSLSLIGLSVLAYCLFDPTKSRRWIILGLTTGIAATFGRNSGVYLAYASLLGFIFIWKWGQIVDPRRIFKAYCSGVILGYTPMIVWFVTDRRFRSAMIASIIFTPHWQLSVPIPFPWRVAQSLASIYKAQVTAISWLCVAVFATYAIFGFVHLRRSVPDATFDRGHILALSALFVGLPFLHQGFDRAGFGHIAQGILPLFILTASHLDASRTSADRAVAVTLVVLALVAWLPSEPLLAWVISRHHNRNTVTSYAIDGRQYQIDSVAAGVLNEAKLIATHCNARDGQVIAMPYYPGILAYLHLKSPYWEMYYLYKRDDAFQEKEISSLQVHHTKLAVVNPHAAMDAEDSLRIPSTNPVLYNYVVSNFTPVTLSGHNPVNLFGDKLSDFEFLTRDCAEASPL